MADLIITAGFANAGEVAGRIGRMRVRIDDAMRRAPHEGAQAAVPAYKAVARVDTGRMREQLHAEGDEVVSTVRDPRSGFAYTGVSRFGHRYATPDRIFPRADREAATVVATRRPRARGGNAALGPMLGGRFFRSVRRFHPAFDWARRGDRA